MEVSSTSSTRHRRLRRCSATSPDQALTSAFTDGQLTPWRRTTARIVITCASATRRCARRRVSRPSNSGCSSSHRLSQPPHTSRRRIHTSVVRRPDTLKVAHRALAGVVHPVALEPAVRATRTPHGRLDPHPQLARRVHNHREHADLAQVQPHPHNIGSHRGPPGSLMMSITDSSRAPTPQRGPSTTPLPTFTRRLNIFLFVSGVGVRNAGRPPQPTADASVSIYGGHAQLGSAPRYLVARCDLSA